MRRSRRQELNILCNTFIPALTCPFSTACNMKPYLEGSALAEAPLSVITFYIFVSLSLGQRA